MFLEYEKKEEDFCVIDDNGDVDDVVYLRHRVIDWALNVWISWMWGNDENFRSCLLVFDCGN